MVLPHTAFVLWKYCTVQHGYKAPGGVGLTLFTFFSQVDNMARKFSIRDFFSAGRFVHEVNPLHAIYWRTFLRFGIFTRPASLPWLIDAI